MSAAGDQLRDQALAQVEKNAHQLWYEAALIAMEVLASGRTPFTSDTVRELIPEELTTHEMRALGAVMREGVRRKIIVPVGWTTEGRSAAHSRPRRLYLGAQAAASDA